ncbi:hypothetical protein CsSME_00004388 [Camellia sinensis var. sinensis]
MATINSGFSTLCSIYRPKSRTLASSSSSSISLRMLQIQVHGNNVNGNPASALVMSNNKYLQRRRAIVVTSVAEEDTLIPEEAAEEIDNIDNNNTEEIKAPEDASTTMTDQPVSVPVSPSDILTMFFQVLEPFLCFFDCDYIHDSNFLCIFCSRHFNETSITTLQL